MNRMVKKFLPLVKQGFKYGLVGILNTIIGYGTFFLLYKAFHVNEYIANICGYILGLINSFIFNKLWTFKTKKFQWKEILFFLLVFAISYGFQFIFFRYLLKTGMKAEIAEIFAMGLYTIIGFLGNKFLTFANKRNEEPQDVSKSQEI